ncbi:MAG: hypothetical protein ACFFD2_10920 [Promethearchaeota archaeon]
MNPFEIYTNFIVEIYDLKEFLKYAKTAPLVIYDPEFFSSPFLDEKKIRCVNCYAIGVRFQGLPIILKYQKSRNNLHSQTTQKRENPKNVIDSSMRAFINQIKSKLHILKGSVHEEKKNSFWNDFLK